MGYPLNERRQLVEFARRHHSGVLVTLVRTEGSSYRQPGARLLVGPAGYTGTISGGCLEGEVHQRAQWMIRDGAHVERYAMTFDDTSDIPFGLGCGGTVDLLFEPMGTPEADALMAALEASLQGGPRRVVHFLPGGGRPLRRLVLDAGGEVVFASDALAAEKIRCAGALAPGSYDGRLVEQLDPPQRLILMGAGDDARPMIELAAQLGWNTVVSDGRAQLARPERFPTADAVKASESLEGLQATREDAIVLMTHSYQQDRNLLAEALALRPRYLGLLGSRHRSSLLIAEAAAMLGRPVADCLEGLSAPVGLDLGGDGPTAIALAVIAEIQAVCHGKAGAARGLTLEEVGRQIDKGGASAYRNAQCSMEVS